MSAFDALAGLATAAADALFGERFEHHPRAAEPNGRPGADASRPPQAFTGIFRDPGRVAGLSIQRQGMESGQGVGVMGATLGVSAPRSAFGVTPQKDDRILRVKTGETFAIDRAEPFGVDQYDIILRRLRRS